MKQKQQKEKCSKQPFELRQRQGLIIFSKQERFWFSSKILQVFWGWYIIPYPLSVCNKLFFLNCHFEPHSCVALILIFYFWGRDVRTASVVREAWEPLPVIQWGSTVQYKAQGCGAACILWCWLPLGPSHWCYPILYFWIQRIKTELLSWALVWCYLTAVDS